MCGSKADKVKDTDGFAEQCLLMKKSYYTDQRNRSEGQLQGEA